MVPAEIRRFHEGQNSAHFCPNIIENGNFPCDDLQFDNLFVDDARFTIGAIRALAQMFLAEWVVGGAWLSQNETGRKRKQSAEVYAREVLRQLRKKLKKSGNLSACDDEQRHEVRKTAKRLRFASEFFASLFDSKNARRRHKRFLGALERLQNKLGTLNDFAMMPLVLEQIGLGDFAQSPALLSTSEKAQLLIVATDAYDELVDAKRFWK